MSFSRHYRILQWRIKRRLDRYEARITDLLYGRVKAHGRLWLLWWLLQGLEWLFKGLVHLRLALYQNRILKQQYLGCMVVVIGNITVGGTGKTPVVEKFARELMARGRRVAILSRGYKRREAPLLKKIFSFFDPEVSAPVVVGDGTGKIRCDWQRAGDEPYMLAKNLPQAIVIVDKNRVKAGAYAIRKFGADTLLLDDGFQYLPLKSRLQLVLVDQTNPFGNGSLLPRGILREPVSSLKRASFVFITKSDGAPPEALLAKIRAAAPHVSPIVCTHSPQRLMTLDGVRARPLEILSGAKIFAFSGIAVPESFEGMLKKSGARIVQSFQFTDHYAYEPEDIEQIVRTAEAGEATMIVTTEKDAVRLPLIQSRLPVYYLRMEVAILSGAKDFGEAIERITGLPDGAPPLEL